MTLKNHLNENFLKRFGKICDVEFSDMKINLKNKSFLNLLITKCLKNSSKIKQKII